MIINTIDNKSYTLVSKGEDFFIQYTDNNIIKTSKVKVMTKLKVGRSVIFYLQEDNNEIKKLYTKEIIEILPE